MKRTSILIGIIVIIMVVIITMKIIFRPPKVGTFKLSEYQDYIENFSSEEVLGSVSSSEDALRIAEEAWEKLYGEGIKKERPYQIFYDTENKVWLIHGSLSLNSMGGVAYILIEEDSGRVLAVWHDK